jgi:hypothetical protein
LLNTNNLVAAKLDQLHAYLLERRKKGKPVSIAELKKAFPGTELSQFSDDEYLQRWLEDSQYRKLVEGGSYGSVHSWSVAALMVGEWRSCLGCSPGKWIWHSASFALSQEPRKIARVAKSS